AIRRGARVDRGAALLELDRTAGKRLSRGGNHRGADHQFDQVRRTEGGGESVGDAVQGRQCGSEKAGPTASRELGADGKRATRWKPNSGECAVDRSLGWSADLVGGLRVRAEEIG